MYIMKKYPKIGIRPTIDGRQLHLADRCPFG